MAIPNDPTPKKPVPPVQGGAPRPAAPAQGGQPAQGGAPRPAAPAQGGAPRPAAPAQGGAPKPAAPAQGGAAKPAQPTQGGAPRPAAPPGAAKPAAPAPGAAKPGVPGAKPNAAAPGAKPAAPGNVPAKPGNVPAKPGAAPAGKPAAGKPSIGKKPANRSKETGKRKFGQVMIDLGFIDDDQLWEILEEAKNTGQLTGQAAVSRGLINEDQLMQALAEQHGMKLLNIGEQKPTPEVLKLVPETMAGVYKVLPLSVDEKARVLTIAIGDPHNLASVDDLRNLLSMNEVIAFLAPQNIINEMLEKTYQGKPEESIIDLIQEMENLPIGKRKKEETSIDLAASLEAANEAPVRKLINMVFLLAIRDKASDIHFEPFEDEYKMRYRCDGVLYEMVPPPRHLAMAISSRIKVMSNLNISERRLPQDGRIELNVGGNPVDMRVSVLPTMFGESVCIRVLDRTVVSLDLNKLGMDPVLLTEFRRLIAKPNGVLLVTGPTSSGKTTTLYSALSELNTIEEKIITTEDPVEYDIDGIIQVPINHEIGMTFAAALRSILRQDPDKILVGEIRDLETAQIAIQAALTGHIVFSTLHTNDAPSTVTRLRDMGVEPFLITACVEGIMAQRLVRKICQECRTEFEPSAEMLMELDLTPEQVKGKKFYYGRGCDRCNNTGCKGRMGLYELLTINDDIRDLISQGASTDELRKECKKMGMQTLREAGLNALHAGLTTIEEVVRETILEDEG